MWEMLDCIPCYPLGGRVKLGGRRYKVRSGHVLVDPRRGRMGALPIQMCRSIVSFNHNVNLEDYLPRDDPDSDPRFQEEDPLLRGWDELRAAGHVTQSAPPVIERSGTWWFVTGRYADDDPATAFRQSFPNLESARQFVEMRYGGRGARLAFEGYEPRPARPMRLSRSYVEHVANEYQAGVLSVYDVMRLLHIPEGNEESRQEEARRLTFEAYHRNEVSADVLLRTFGLDRDYELHHLAPTPANPDVQVVDSASTESAARQAFSDVEREFEDGYEPPDEPGDSLTA